MARIDPYYLNAQGDSAKQWGIAQKQTGRRYVYVGWEFVFECSWPRPHHETAHIKYRRLFYADRREGKRIRCRRDENKSYSELQLVAMVCWTD